LLQQSTGQFNVPQDINYGLFNYGLMIFTANAIVQIIEHYKDASIETLRNLGHIDITSTTIKTLALFPLFALVVLTVIGDSGNAVAGAHAQSSTAAEFYGLILIVATLGIGAIGLGLSPLVPKSEYLAIGVFIVGAIVVMITSTGTSYFNRVSVSVNSQLYSSNMGKIFNQENTQLNKLNDVADVLEEKDRLTVGENNVLTVVGSAINVTNGMKETAKNIKPDPKDIYGNSHNAFMLMQAAATSIVPFIFSFLFGLLLKSIIVDRLAEAAAKTAELPASKPAEKQPQKAAQPAPGQGSASRKPAVKPVEKQPKLTEEMAVEFINDDLKGAKGSQEKARKALLAKGYKVSTKRKLGDYNKAYMDKYYKDSEVVKFPKWRGNK
jgi:hypothetical protein